MADQTDAKAIIDARIAALPAPFREALTHLRQTILAAAPEATEIITYQMPGIGFHGALVSYDGFKTHCSLFPMGSSVLTGMDAEIAPFRTSTGTLQFTPDTPLPDALVTKIVRARVAENLAKAEAKKAKRKSAGK